MEEFIPIVLFISLFGSFAFVTRVISDNRLRREMINNQVSPEVIQKLFLEGRAENFNANLKWGIVSIALGLALVIIQFTQLSSEQPLSYGITLIAGGAGLLLYYRLMRDEM